MTTLYITSTAPYAGKSALCVGLGKHFQRNGYSLGYMRPVATTRTLIGECTVDQEASLMCETLGLKEPMEWIWPVCFDGPTVEAILKGEGEKYVRRVLDAFLQISKRHDVVLLEGGSRCTQGLAAGLSCEKIAEMVQAQVLVVAKYDVPTPIVVDDLLADKSRLGDRMIGAVLNGVEPKRLGQVQDLVVPYLENQGIPVYAVLPLDRIFLTVSIGELAEALGGEIICRPDLADSLVENLMIGAMSVDSALRYLHRKLNKAVITGGDRADMQLAAIETATRCLILTGNLQPSPMILNRAEEAGVAMILVKHDTMTTAQIAEDAFGKTRFFGEAKIKRFLEMLDEHFDFDKLYETMGLQRRA